jgi:hypothetical protein
VTLESVALFSQVLAAVAVFASLIFVGMQIRLQATATRAQTEQAIAANWLAVADVMGSNAGAVTAGLISTSDTLAELNDAERLQFFSIMFGFFKHYENIYLQYRRGRISQEEWEPCSSHALMFLHQPGVQAWWRLRKGVFAPQFRDFLERSIKPDDVTIAAIHEAHAEAKAKSGG